MKALKKLTEEQQQNPLVKDIEREYKKEKEKISSELEQNRTSNIYLGLFAFGLAALTAGNAAMDGQADSSKMFGLATLGVSMLAIGGLIEQKNTVYSMESKAMLNVIKPYLNPDEKDSVKNVFRTQYNNAICISGSAMGFLGAASSYFAEYTTLEQSASIGALTGGASGLAQEVVRAKVIKENHRFLSNKVRYLIQNNSR